MGHAREQPPIKQLVDEFVQSHAVGTSFGGTLLRRYLQNTKWLKNSTSAEEMKKYQANLELFQKYVGEYDFDYYLMIAAQGYQESLLDQSKKNPSGAVGVTQVIPKNAAASTINISSVGTADSNIHAGVKMLRNIADTYFNVPQDRQSKQDIIRLCQLQRRTESYLQVGLAAKRDPGEGAKALPAS